jgi:hypothetical protein
MLRRYSLLLLIARMSSWLFKNWIHYFRKSFKNWIHNFQNLCCQLLNISVFSKVNKKNRTNRGRNPRCI